MKLLHADRAACERDRRPALDGSCATTRSCSPASEQRTTGRNSSRLSAAARDNPRHTQQRKDEEPRPDLRPTHGPINGWSNTARTALDQRIAEVAGRSLPHWTPHDLRRSFATHAAGIGIQPHIIEACLNHVSGHKAGVAGIYNKAAYEPEKRTALDRWAAHLLAVVEGKESNVSALRRGA